MTGKQIGKLPKNKMKSNRISAKLPQKDDAMNKAPDLSVLRIPIQTSVTGFQQARNVFDTGTEEIKQLLSTECDVIYECRVCRNLFRSLANFISHKRIYCRQKFNTSLHAHFINSKYLKDDMMTILQNEKDYQNYLMTKDHTPEMQAGKESLKKTFTKDLTSIIEKLSIKQACESGSSTENPTVKLQPSSQTTKAVYQNYVGKASNQELIREQVEEIAWKEASDVAVLGPDGKVMMDSNKIEEQDKNSVPVIQISDDEDNAEEISDKTIICRICKINFATQKTLRFHMKYKHAENKLVYPCPDCTETFANAWGVYRHLFKVHRKSAAYIRKLRESIHNKAYKLQRKALNQTNTDTPEEAEILSEQHRLDLENQEWMDNLEGDCEVPRCGGCGRRFERRAALSAHRQTCQLRIAAQNKITVNMQKRLAAKVAIKEISSILTKPSVNQSDDKAESSPAKLTRVETKPIEIQIRKDYHKSGIGSPKRTGTPVTESNGSVLDTGEASRKGEIGESIINVHSSVGINKHYTDNIVTVKDNHDDANVLCNSNHSGNSNASSEVEDDDELNFEDIRRVCQGNKEVHGDSPLMEVDAESANDADYVVICAGGDSETIQALETSFTCNKCKEVLTSLDNLNEHITKKHKVTKHQCKFCNYKSKEMKECIDHVKVKHKMLGDDERIKKFVKSVSVPLNEQSSDTSDEETPEQSSKFASQTLIDDSKEVALEPAEVVMIEDDSLTPPKAAKETSRARDEIQSNSSTSANCSDVEGDSALVKRKRGRPRKFEKTVEPNQLEKRPKLQLPLKGAKLTSLVVKKPHKVESVPSSPHNLSDVEEIQTTPEKSMSERPKSETKKTNTPLCLSDTQHSASSVSSTVKRPIRNRVKPLNKDFEYDLSNLLKLEAEAYKESHFPTVMHKQPLKRKPLLQNETMPSEQSTEVVEQKGPSKQVVERVIVGALLSLSTKAAEKMKAHMKQVPLMAPKELPAFIAQRRSRTTPIMSSPKASVLQVSKKEVIVPLKMKMEKEKNATQPPTTPSMIYEKLSLDNNRKGTERFDQNKTDKLSRRHSTSAELKHEILTNMSLLMSKTTKLTFPNRILKSPGDDGVNKISQSNTKLVSLNKDKELPILPKEKTAGDKTDDSNVSIPSGSASSAPSGKIPCKHGIDDETSEFVASEKLTSVNILRRKKAMIHMKTDKNTARPLDGDVSVLALTSKFYKRKIAKVDDVAGTVGVSEINKDGPVLEEEKEKASEPSVSLSVENKSSNDDTTAPLNSETIVIKEEKVDIDANV